MFSNLQLRTLVFIIFSKMLKKKKGPKSCRDQQVAQISPNRVPSAWLNALVLPCPELHRATVGLFDINGPETLLNVILACLLVCSPEHLCDCVVFRYVIA